MEKINYRKTLKPQLSAYGLTVTDNRRRHMMEYLKYTEIN